MLSAKRIVSLHASSKAGNNEVKRASARTGPHRTSGFWSAAKDRSWRFVTWPQVHPGHEVVPFPLLRREAALQLHHHGRTSAPAASSRRRLGTCARRLVGSRRPRRPEAALGAVADDLCANDQPPWSPGHITHFSLRSASSAAKVSPHGARVDVMRSLVGLVVSAVLLSGCMSIGRSYDQSARPRCTSA